MTAGALCVTVALLLAPCNGNGAPDNACAVGGALEVFSTPAGLPVTAAQCDVVYDKEEWQLAPTVKYLQAKPGETYTLFKIDPDAPDRPRGVYYLHWILANIPGEDFQSGNLMQATEISAYQGPAPPEGTGLHRYMFYVYRHFPSSGRLSGSFQQSDVEFFNLKDYLRSSARQGVRLRGPIAGVQYRSEFEFNPVE